MLWIYKYLIGLDYSILWVFKWLMLYFMSTPFYSCKFKSIIDQIIYKNLFKQLILLDTGFQNGRYSLSPFVIDFIVIVIKSYFTYLLLQEFLLFCHKPYINGEFFTLESYILLKKTYLLYLLQLLHLGI